MSFGLANDGEVAFLQYYFDNNTVEIGLYLDDTDALSDSDNEPDVTTEPTGSNYARETLPASEVTIQISNGNALLSIGTQTFDVSDSTQNVDAVFFYNSNDDFFLRAELDTSSYPNDYIDLDKLNDLNVGGAMLTLD